MTEDELFNFKLLTAMTDTMKTTLFVQNSRPSLQETLDFVDNQVVVENMTQKAVKKAETVNNIEEETEKPKNIKCWICNGGHTRDKCTADKNSLRYENCKLTGHVTEACWGRRRTTRTPSRSGWSTRSPSSSSTDSTSSSTEERRRRRKKEKEVERREKDQESCAATRLVAGFYFRLWQQELLHLMWQQTESRQNA